MKAAVWESVNNIRVKETGVPIITDGEVLIKVAYAGICGSDNTILSGKHVTARPPVILGHEFSGVIAESRSIYFKKGDRVTVEPLVSCCTCKSCIEGNYHVCSNLKLLGVHENGAFADYAKASDRKTFKIPDNMSLIEAAMIEPFSVALHAIDASHLRIGDMVLVVGAGPIGAIIGLLASNCGAGKVMISELSEFRLNYAKKSGLLTFNASSDGGLSEFIMGNTGNNGVDIAFECGGTKSSVKACLESIGIKGKLIQVGLPKEPVETDYRNMVYKEQEIVGIRVYREGTFKRAIQFLSEKNIVLEDLVSDVFKLENIMQAFERANDKNNSLKVLIDLQPL